MIPASIDCRFEVTTKCNYRCTICPYPTLERAKETMSTALFVQLLDKVLAETSQYEMVTFAGMGEPLLDRDIEGKIRHATARGLRCTVITNASMLSTERFLALQEAGLHSMRVSFYGTTPESYAKVHGIRDLRKFEAVKQTLEEICRRKTSCQVLMTFNRVDDNVADMDEWIAYWGQRVDLLEVWHPHNWGTTFNYREIQPDLLPTCGRATKGPLQIQVDGTVNMCCFDFQGKLLLGDLKTQTLAEIFSGDAFGHILACHTTGNYAGSGLICEHCDQRNPDKSKIMIHSSRDNPAVRALQTSSGYETLAPLASETPPPSDGRSVSLPQRAR